MPKPKISEYYYSSEEYKEKLEELAFKKEEILQQKKEEAAIKEKEVKTERLRLKKIFTKDRCGAENIHFVLALIDRAAFLKVELEHMEDQLRLEGVMDFFTQGVQTMWREHPLSKVHVQYTKNYKEIITKLESYGQTDSKSQKDDNPLGSLISRGNAARGKYGK